MQTYIAIAALMIGGIGLFVGIFLGVASQAFFVPVDEREEAIQEALPGANCGACGYSGCGALARALVSGEADVNACVVGQEPVASKIAEILGKEAGVADRKVAYVHCSGDCEKTRKNYQYTGVDSCRMAMIAPGRGGKSCTYGCLGFGDCMKVCEYDAIRIQNGIAVISASRCMDCKQCIKTCPKGLIGEISYDATTVVMCSNPEKGKAVMEECTIGCITCKKCEKVCESGAITMEKGFPIIQEKLCTGCGKCIEACPRKCIGTGPKEHEELDTARSA